MLIYSSEKRGFYALDENVGVSAGYKNQRGRGREDAARSNRQGGGIPRVGKHS